MTDPTPKWFMPEALNAAVPQAEQLIEAARHPPSTGMFQSVFLEVTDSSPEVVLSCLMQWAHLPGACGYTGTSLAPEFQQIVGADSPWVPRFVELVDAGAAGDPARTARAILNIRAGLTSPGEVNGLYFVTYLMAIYAGRTIAVGGAYEIASIEALLKGVSDDPATWHVRAPVTMIICALGNGARDEAGAMFARLLKNHRSALSTGVFPLLAGTLAALGEAVALVSVDDDGVPDAVATDAAVIDSGAEDEALRAAAIILELVKAVRSGSQDWLKLIANQVSGLPAEMLLLMLWQMFTSAGARIAQLRAQGEDPSRRTDGR